MFRILAAMRFHGYSSRGRGDVATQDKQSLQK